MNDDIMVIVRSYVGSALSGGILQDIRRSAYQRSICLRRHTNFLHYDLQDNYLTAIFLTRICHCPDIVCCSRPSCYFGRHIVGYVNIFIRHDNRRAGQLRITYRQI